MSEVLHGGAERLPIRYVNPGTGAVQVSRYRVAPGSAVTLHVHTGKTESWVVVAGTGVARVGNDEFEVKEGDVIAAPPGVPHRLENTGGQTMVFINIVERTGEPVTTTELEHG